MNFCDFFLNFGSRSKPTVDTRHKFTKFHEVGVDAFRSYRETHPKLTDG